VPATVVAGVAVTASVKSGGGEFTCRVNVFVFAAGAPAVVAERVTVELPKAVLEEAVTVNVTVTGVDKVGLTVAEGENTHAVPVGSPVGQVRVTEPANEPRADTTKVLWLEVPPGITVSVLGLGEVSAKSTTCRTTGASWVVVFESVPTAWALKL